jgi:hypothetical protein
MQIEIRIFMVLARPDIFFLLLIFSIDLLKLFEKYHSSKRYSLHYYRHFLMVEYEDCVRIPFHD